MEAAVVVNTRSGRSAATVAELPGRLAAAGISAVSFDVVANERELRRRVKRARKAGARTIVVGGGDGSLATAVDVLATHDAVLGVLPLGTGNSFARTLGLDGSLEGAIEALVTQRIEAVDLGIVNGTYFANFATIGLSAEIAEAVPKKLKGVIGPLAYVAGALGPYARLKPFRARVRWDDGRKEFETVQMIVASGRFFGHQPLAADVTATSRRLAFYATSGVSHLEVARMYLALGLGKGEEVPDAVTFATREVSVKAEPRQLVSIDGNPLGCTPATFTIAPAALRAIVGPHFDGVTG